ncbi:MAG TPA: hypothetical protein VJ836_04425 [Candidatus Saccharimonadales bacterium]|nr:hypothetical protein [Candidatus Saccharimonadales bacterium]
MKQSNPGPAVVAKWLKTINRETLHAQGWIEINKRFHGIARAARPYIQEHFTDPKEQEAAFDGLTLALLTMARFQDIEQLTELFGTPQITEQVLPEPTIKPAAKPELGDHCGL